MLLLFLGVFCREVNVIDFFEDFKFLRFGVGLFWIVLKISIIDCFVNKIIFFSIIENNNLLYCKW